MNWVDRRRHGSVYVIAEIGVNHGGDVSLARRMVDAAKDAGADAVKFQTFRADTLALPKTPKVAYQTRTTPVTESHYEMLRGLELSRPAHAELFAHCESTGVEFLSTPYDTESVQFLLDLGVALFKAASADLVDLPLQSALAESGRPVLLSTGMSTLSEIAEALRCYPPSDSNPVLLHCVSNYPCSDDSLNLRALQTLRATFNRPVGYSDHSAGALAAPLAVALGACVIEKHFTLNREWPGPDHRASSEPDEFRELVAAIRRAEASLGTAEKACQPEEAQMARVSRKSIVTTKALAVGHVLTAADLALRRPGTGLMPMALPGLLGRRVRRPLEAWNAVSLDDLE